MHSLESVSAMRVRDLRKLLLKLGMNQVVMSKLIDKTDLIAAAIKLLGEQENERELSERLFIAYYVSVGLGVLLVMYLCKDLLLAVISSLRQFMLEETYRAWLKLRTLRMAIKYRRFAAILALVMSLVCDILVGMINLSIIGSWVLPRSNFLRRYLISTLSLPMVKLIFNTTT